MSKSTFNVTRDGYGDLYVTIDYQERQVFDQDQWTLRLYIDNPGGTNWRISKFKATPLINFRFGGDLPLDHRDIMVLRSYLPSAQVGKIPDVVNSFELVLDDTDKVLITLACENES